jgi:hypothetical protein
MNKEEIIEWLDDISYLLTIPETPAGDWIEICEPIREDIEEIKKLLEEVK